MWNNINDNEKKFLLDYYFKGGTGNKVILVFLGFFLCKNIIVNTERNLILSGCFGILLLSFILLYLNNSLSRKRRKSSIENGEVKVCEGNFVAYRRVGRRKRRNTYEVDVVVWDDFNNTEIYYQCYYMGRSFEITKLNVGDKMYIFKFENKNEKLKTIEIDRV